MMRYDNGIPSLIVVHGFLDEPQTTLVLTVEVGITQEVLTIENPVEIGDTKLSSGGVLQVNMGPERRDYEDNVIDFHDLIVIVVDVRPGLALSAILHGSEVVLLIELWVAKTYKDPKKGRAKPGPSPS